MLIDKNISPDNFVYLNAAYVLGVLLRDHELSLADLYVEVRRVRRMSFSMFTLCLDWLYLINAITINNETIALCSSNN
jgi:hypothetical protein